MADDLSLVMIDTPVWVEAFRGSDPKMVEAVRDLLINDRVAICGPVRFELLQGLRPHERKKIFPLLEAVPSLDFDERDWLEAGELAAALRRKGKTLPMADVLIGHLCRKNGLPILTLDKHFHDIPKLKQMPVTS